jgi:hypothetical protein
MKKSELIQLIREEISQQVLKNSNADFTYVKNKIDYQNSHSDSVDDFTYILITIESAIELLHMRVTELQESKTEEDNGTKIFDEIPNFINEITKFYDQCKSYHTGGGEH